LRNGTPFPSISRRDRKINLKLRSNDVRNNRLDVPAPILNGLQESSRVP
jgi:hypothetical protein